MREGIHYLPQDTIKTGITHNAVENVALRLQKYRQFYTKDCKANLSFQKSTNKIMNFCSRHLYAVSHIPNQKLETLYLSTDWRMVTGLGCASVYETSITLHPVYGFPYIPGQAVKGLCRSYLINRYYQNEEEAVKDLAFTQIFGSQNQKGKVIFYDALPCSTPVLDFDVMNVHYKDYYTTGKEPTDDQKLNLISFITVKNTVFAFAVGVEDRFADQIDLGNFQENSFSEIITNALILLGAGAKTAVGYGRMSPASPCDEFKLCYDRLNTQARYRAEAAKPKHEKLTEELSFRLQEALEFIRDEKNSLQAREFVSEKIAAHFKDPQVWALKKKNGQQYEFANAVHEYLVFSGYRSPENVAYIRKYGSKKLKKKY